MASWIKIFRELLQWEWFEKAEMVQFFIYLLLKANSEDKSWQGIIVKRGSFVTSNAEIRRDLKLSEQNVRTCIKRLISTGEITYKSTNKYIIITICNFDRYQETKKSINEQINEQTNEQSTSNQRATNEQINEQSTNKSDCVTGSSVGADSEINEQGSAKSTTTKEYKNINNIIDIKQERGSSPTPPSASDEAKASKPKNDVLPAKEIKDMWNDLCPGFPKLVVISENRRNKMRLRIAEMGGVEKAMPLLKTIFGKMQASPFLKGDNKRGWKASFDWLFENDKNWVKVYEGNYDANTPAPSTPNRYKPKNDVNDLWNE